MKNLIYYRVYLNRTEVSDEVYAKLVEGGVNESGAFKDLEPFIEYMDGTTYTRWSEPDEEITEELEVLSLE